MLPALELANPYTDGALSCFPPEILARIFRLAWADSGLVRICSVINKSFRAFACRLVFVSICCGEPTVTTRTIKRWHICLMHSPHLAHYIRDIVVIGHFPDSVNHLARLVHSCNTGIRLRTLTLRTPLARNVVCSARDSLTILSPFSHIAIDAYNINADICFHLLKNAAMLTSLQIGVAAPCQYLNVGGDAQLSGPASSSGLKILKIHLTPDVKDSMLSEDGVLRVFLRVERMVRWSLSTFEFSAPARCTSGLPVFLGRISQDVQVLTLLVDDKDSIFWPVIDFDVFVHLTELRLRLAEENIDTLCLALSSSSLSARLTRLDLEICIDTDSVPSRWYLLGETLHGSDLCLLTGVIKAIIRPDALPQGWGSRFITLLQNINAHSHPQGCSLKLDFM